MPIERIICKLLGIAMLSGLVEDPEMSIEDARLPGVLPESAGLTVLTLALGSLRVVTDSCESSPMGASMPAARSDVESTEGRLVWRTGEFEKNSGENKVSRMARTEALVRGAAADAGISNFLGGEVPVRAFLDGAGVMSESSCAAREGRLPRIYSGGTEAAVPGWVKRRFCSDEAPAGTPGEAAFGWLDATDGTGWPESKSVDGRHDPARGEE